MALTSQPPEANDPAARVFTRALDSSLILGPLWRVCRESAVCRVLLRCARSLSGRSSFIVSRAAHRHSTREFGATKKLAVTSSMFGMGDRVLRDVPAAWSSSFTRRMLSDLTGPIDAALGFQMLGIALIVAALTHAALDASHLFHSRGAMWAWLLLISAGLLLIAGRRQLATAWSHRR